MTAHRIRIIGIPPGEAPLGVREKWVGLELPLQPGRTGAYQLPCVGVLSKKDNRGPVIGYLVAADEAVRILESKAPDAASWWRAHAATSISPGKALMFDEYVCEPIED